MLPILRSVTAQVLHRGGRSVGSFSSSPGITEFQVHGVIRKGLTMAAGYFIGVFAFNGYSRRLEEIDQENIREHEENERRSEELARRLNLS